MFQVPFRKNNNFVGRADILNEMEQNLRHHQLAGDCVPLVLSGLGGMGKSQLMLKYCYAHRKEYRYIFWLNAEGSQETREGFRNLAKDLGIKVDEDPKISARGSSQGKKDGCCC